MLGLLLLSFPSKEQREASKGGSQVVQDPVAVFEIWEARGEEVAGWMEERSRHLAAALFTARYSSVIAIKMTTFAS